MDEYPGETIDIMVNDRDLAELVGAVERPFAEAEGHTSIAGSYGGLSPGQLAGTPMDHFFGSPKSHLFCGPEGKTVLLGCECGEPGCWPLMARIDVRDVTVAWVEFEQPHRRDVWSHVGISFEFDRTQYQAAVAEIA